ncbi:MAG: gamma-glutamyltransferase family protein [Gaiellales bacterium]
MKQYGTISLPRALAPAIEVALRGFAIPKQFPRAERFKAFTSSRELYFDENLEPPAVGSVFRNPDLARTYQLIVRDGVDAFYRGPIARAIVDTIQHPPLAEDASEYVNAAAMRPGKMELSDLADYRQPAISPTHVQYRGYDVYSSPPPSSGGSTVGEALNILEGFDLSGPDRTLAQHRFIEAAKLAYADRARYIGDPEFVDVPLDELLSQDYADERRCLIGEHAMQAPVAAGDATPPYDTSCSGSELGQEEGEHEGSTAHLSVVDRWGNTVSLTSTNVSSSAVVVPGYGFLLNNEMTNFNPKPLFEGDPNLTEGGKRPRGNMAPTVVVRDGQPVLSVGVAGGQTIQTTVLNILINHLDFGMGLPEALSAGRASQRNTATTLVDPDFRCRYGDELTARFGHRFSGPSVPSFAQGVSILPDGHLVAVADPRGVGYEAGVVTPTEFVGDSPESCLAESVRDQMAANGVVVDKAIDNTDQVVSYDGDWQEYAVSRAYGGSWHTGFTADGLVEIPFTGTRARYFATKGPRSGRGDVYVDGEYQTTVDFYEPSQTIRLMVFDTGELDPGNHTIRVEVTGTGNPEADLKVITFDALGINN